MSIEVLGLGVARGLEGQVLREGGRRGPERSPEHDATLIGPGHL